MIIVHDKRLPERYKEALKSKVPDIEFIPFEGIASENKVYQSIFSHPDIYLFQLDKRAIVHAPGVSRDNLKPFLEKDFTLIKGEEDPGGRYPDTVRYNAVRVGGHVFCNQDHIDPAVAREVKKRDLKSVSINQGYARCSTLPVGEEAIITTDNGIADAAAKEGLDVLLVSPEGIILPGEKRGFIGGTGGACPDGTLVILGDLDMLPEGQRIKRFITKHKVRLITLDNMAPYDAGSILII